MTETIFPFANLGLSRRQMMAGAAVAGAGLAAAPKLGHAQGQSLDLDSAEGNLTALLKMQGDLAEKPVLSGFSGKAWGWVPNERNYLLFNTFGIGASRLELREDEGGYRFYHREILYYLDPQSGEVLDTWNNPMTGREVEVLHIINDPVNRFYRTAPGGRFGPPFDYTVNGDDLVFQIDVFRAEENNPMPRKDYPLHAQQDVYQSAELWGIYGRVSEIMDPNVTSASTHTAWARVGMWLPFMEMGNRPGVMVYHSQSFKLMDGAAGLPDYIRKYTEKNYPKYLEAPAEWQDLSLNENTWTISKKEIDKRREKGKDGSVFGKKG